VAHKRRENQRPKVTRGRNDPKKKQHPKTKEMKQGKENVTYLKEEKVEAKIRGRRGGNLFKKRESAEKEKRRKYQIK